MHLRKEQNKMRVRTVACIYMCKRAEIGPRGMILYTCDNERITVYHNNQDVNSLYNKLLTDGYIDISHLEYDMYN